MTFPAYFSFLNLFLSKIGKTPETTILVARETPDRLVVLDAIYSSIIEEMQGTVIVGRISIEIID
jgi:hypothetical protein